MKLYCLICAIIGVGILLAPDVLSQSSTRQLGIGIRPQQDAATAWFVVGKKNLGKALTLRAGLGGGHSRREQILDFASGWTYYFIGGVDEHYFEYEYTKRVTKGGAHVFVGLERKFGWKDLLFYVAADGLLDYDRSSEAFVAQYLVSWGPPLPHPRFFDLPELDQRRVWRPGVALSLGGEYFVTSRVSVMLEAGVSFSRNFQKSEKTTRHFSWYEEHQELIVREHAPEKKETSGIRFNFIRLVTLQYHW